MIECVYSIEVSLGSTFIMRRSKKDNRLLTVYNRLEQFMYRTTLHDFNLYNEDQDNVKFIHDEVKSKYPELLI
jgi:hypothetical protein